MLTKKDRLYSLKRKRIWDKMGYIYKSINQLSKNHSLSCNCSICRYKKFEKDYRHSQNRNKIKRELKIYLKNES